MRYWFKTPVSIWTGIASRRTVISAEDALQLLREDWPDEDGTAAARHTLLAALESGSVDAAEEAFREAARKVGWLVE